MMIRKGTVSIADNRNIHESVRLGQFVIIEEDVVIGDGVEIGNFVLIKAGTKIGRKTFVDSYVKMSGNCIIGDGCTLRYNSTIARNVTLGNCVFFSPNVMTVYEKDKWTYIGNNVFIGSNSVIGAGVTIVKEISVGALSFVNDDLRVPGGLFIGVPARWKIRKEEKDGRQSDSKD